MRVFKPKNRGKESQNFALDHTERGHRLRIGLGTGDEALAKEIAAEEIRKWRLQHLADLYQLETHSAERAEAPAVLIVEYLSVLEDRGVTEKHRDDVRRHLGSMFDLMGAKSLVDVTPEAIRTALAKIKRSARTRNKHRGDLKAFFSWLVREERWGRNPCDAIPAFREIADRERRSLTLAELLDLFAKTPRHRSLVYRVAACTGLRRKELSTLHRRVVDLKQGTVGVLVKRAKSRKSAVLPIDQETRALWQKFWDEGEAFFEGKWTGFERMAWRQRLGEGQALPPIPSVRTYYRDLARIGVLELDKAGVPIQDPDFRTDLHALRTTFGTTLARAGVSLTVAQGLMRHSDPRLTANVYTKLELEDGRQAIAELGKILRKKTDGPQPGSVQAESA